jgi:hypothetical protein
MSDTICVRLDETEKIEGVLEGITMHRVRSALGVSSFGLSIVDMGPNAAEYPEHDHSPEGIGAKMFAKRPAQLGQEEVYIALRGSGEVEVDGERYPLDAEHLVRVGPAAKRKVWAGDEGLRLLALGGTPGQPYEAAETPRPS